MGNKPTVILAGDSVFDNATYVTTSEKYSDKTEGCVAQLLRRKARCQVTLAAVDGSVMEDLPGQLESLGCSTGPVFISSGGNNLLRRQFTLREGLEQGTTTVDDIAADFRERYNKMLDAVVTVVPACRIGVCTLYPPNTPTGNSGVSDAVVVGVNAIIHAVAADRGIHVVDLYKIFRGNPECYANPIEPSVEGGRRICDALIATLPLLKNVT